MSNIIIKPWGETPAERAARQRGFSMKEESVLEWGTQFSAVWTRKDQVDKAIKTIARGLWELRQAAAEQKWDDEKCAVFLGMQIRNGWEEVGDGEWVETGSPEWLAHQASKA